MTWLLYLAFFTGGLVAGVAIGRRERRNARFVADSLENTIDLGRAGPRQPRDY